MRSANDTLTRPNMPKFFIVLATVLLLCGSSVSETRSAPILQKDLVGAWAGCAQGCTEFYRLDLKSDGSGSLVILDPRLEHDLYLISDWKIEVEQLHMI